MLVSCLTVTQPSRWEHLQRAIHCFQRQTWSEKQLVLVVDGDDEYCQRLRSLCDLQNLNAKVILGQGPTLGDLRNESVAAADGQLICCWDDDDQYHSNRLAIQAHHLLQSDADYCYLSGCLHYFTDTGDLSWVDWRRQGNGKFHPNLPNFRAIGGSIMAHKQRMMPYPSHDLGEDSMFLSFAVLRKVPILILDGYGWCYLRCCHGENTTTRLHQELVNSQRSRRLDFQEIDQVVARMRQQYDTDFSISKLLKEYRFNHDSVELKGHVSTAC